MKSQHHTTTVGTFEKFARISGELRQGQRWIFRGQADSKWPLSSKLERLYKATGARGDKKFGPREAENFMLREIKRNYHRYSPYCPRRPPIFE